MNNMMYLFGLVIAICLLFQKSTMQLFNSSFIGRICLFSSVMIAAMYNHLGGLLYGFFLLSVLNFNYLENFEQTTPSTVKEEETPPVKEVTIDREKEEKKIITPVSSKDMSTPVIPLNYESNESGIVSPSAVVESMLNYSEYNPLY